MVTSVNLLTAVTFAQQSFEYPIITSIRTCGLILFWCVFRSPQNWDTITMGHIIELDLYMGLIGLVLVWPMCLLHWVSLSVCVLIHQIQFSGVNFISYFGPSHKPQIVSPIFYDDLQSKLKMTKYYEIIKSIYKNSSKVTDLMECNKKVLNPLRKLIMQIVG